MWPRVVIIPCQNQKGFLKKSWLQRSWKQAFAIINNLGQRLCILRDSYISFQSGNADIYVQGFKVNERTVLFLNDCNSYLKVTIPIIANNYLMIKILYYYCHYWQGWLYIYIWLKRTPEWLMCACKCENESCSLPTPAWESASRTSSICTEMWWVS